jgi:AhpD family alkylhydroperoxidase
MLDERTKELVAVGASIVANCQPCLEYHTAKARELGATTEDILAAVTVGQQVRRGAGAKMDRFAGQHVTGEPVHIPAAGCECQ